MHLNLLLSHAIKANHRDISLYILSKLASEIEMDRTKDFIEWDTLVSQTDDLQILRKGYQIYLRLCKHDKLFRSLPMRQKTLTPNLGMDAVWTFES